MKLHFLHKWTDWELYTLYGSMQDKITKNYISYAKRRKRRECTVCGINEIIELENK